MYDPNDPKNLEVCYVCQDVPKPGHQHLKNYGSIVCFSCRAFWRRIHQKTRTPKMKCAFGDSCEITVATRRRCKKCRFTRCQETGMDPGAVLNPNQKTIRFRRLIKKQMREETKDGNPLEMKLGPNQYPTLRFKRKKTDANGKSKSTPTNDKRKGDELVNNEDDKFGEFQSEADYHDYQESGSDKRKKKRKQNKEEKVKTYAIKKKRKKILENAAANNDDGFCEMDEQDDSNQELRFNIDSKSDETQNYTKVKIKLKKKSQAPSSVDITNSNQIGTKTRIMNPGQFSDTDLNGEDLYKFMPKLIRIRKNRPKKQRTASIYKAINNSDILFQPTHCGNYEQARSVDFVTCCNESKLPTLNLLQTASFKMPSSRDQRRAIDITKKDFCNHSKPFQQSQNFRHDYESDFDAFRHQKSLVTDRHYLINITTYKQSKSIRNDLSHFIELKPLTMQTQDHSSSHESNCEPDLETITRAYSLASLQGHIQQTEALLGKLTMLNADTTHVEISKAEILEVMKMMSQMFRHFALIIREFGLLDKRLQLKLMSRNSPIFVQLQLGLHLLYRDTYQTDCCKKKKAWMSHFGQTSKILKLNRITNLFVPSANTDQYGGLISKLAFLPSSCTIEQSSVLAFLILFDHDESFSIDHRSKLSKFKSMSESLCSLNLNSAFQPSDLMPTLLAMTKFCSENVDWQDRHHQPPPKIIFEISQLKIVSEGAYTQEEEHWLQGQLHQAEEALRSVTPDETTFWEILSAKQCGTISEDLTASVLRMLMERTLRVCKIHPEFSALSADAQRSLIRRNVPLGVGLIVARLVNCKTVVEQLQNFLGEINEKRWQCEHMPAIQKLQNFQKMTLEDVLMFNHLNLKSVHHHTKNLSVLSSNSDMFKLVLMLVMTWPADYSGMSTVHNTYLTLLHRRSLNNPICKIQSKLPQECLEQVFAHSASIVFIGNLVRDLMNWRQPCQTS